RAALLVTRLRGEGYRGDVRLAPSARVALAEADVVCLATASPTPLFDPDELRPGTHVNGVGAYKPTMAEMPPAAVARARVVVDQRVAAWAEAGDLIQAREAGLIDEDHIVGELGEVVAGRVAGRTEPAEI